jgi:hypothetical protein
VQWALEELGLPYRVHPVDHTGGELDGPACLARPRKRLRRLRARPALEPCPAPRRREHLLPRPRARRPPREGAPGAR